MRKLRWVKAILAVAGCFGLTIVCLSINPPQSLLRVLMRANSSHLLAAHPSLSPLAGPIQRLVPTYFEFALAARIAARVAAHGDTDDVARIDYALRRVQIRVLNGIQVPHDSRSWPPLVAGIGYCDQVNGAACEILAHFYNRPELYAFYDPVQNISPHAVGRVWSKSRQEWLYFDAFCDRPVVFRRRADQSIEILNHPQVTFPARKQPPLDAYRLSGWVLNRYSATYPKYLIYKAYSAAFGDAEGPIPVTESAVNAAAPAAGPPVETPTADAGPKADAGLYTRIASAYVRARADDLLGSRDQAKERYRAIASDKQAARDVDAAVLQAAALEFAQQ
jgi:hypothetical protein